MLEAIQDAASDVLSHREGVRGAERTLLTRPSSEGEGVGEVGGGYEGNEFTEWNEGAGIEGGGKLGG